VPATLNRLPALKSQSSAEPGNLIDQLLAEQKKLQTPVAQFSEVHHRRAPDLADHYRTLIPLTKPGFGEQYAFEVSLDRCTGCKACVSACHSLNGLDDDEVWRDVGTLLGGKSAPGWKQTITSACHHCEDPGCLNGCPVGAYEKDADTGIVRHLDDQCIGCSYCILKCPYDVPKYSIKRGIVRKCDMCHQRLAEGEAPACVQACPTEAIRIVKVTQGQLMPRLFEAEIEHPQSALPSSEITRPTTRYVGREVPVGASPADQLALIPQHAHWPLVFMLVFTQAGIGLLLGSESTAATLTGALIFYAGMLASVFHLGQPLKAWRFFIGLRTSWLSREILAFSLFAPLPFVLSSLPLLPDFPLKALTSQLAALSILPLGMIAVFTSVMIYHDTHRALWRFPLGACRFFGTVASFAALAHLMVSPSSSLLQGLYAAAILFKLSPELRLLKLAKAKNVPWTADVHSARLQLGPLSRILRGRLALGLAALVLGMFQPWLAVPILLVAEVLERQLFFQSVHAPKMPGNFGPPSKHG
jgi:formate dehydrogenase iron-sulfur subunit